MQTSYAQLKTEALAGATYTEKRDDRGKLHSDDGPAVVLRQALRTWHEYWQHGELIRTEYVPNEN